MFTRPDSSPIATDTLTTRLTESSKAVPGTEPCTIFDFCSTAVNRLISTGAFRPQIAKIKGWSDERVIDNYAVIDYQRKFAALSIVVPKG